MAFNGVHPALPLEPTQFGLFAAVPPITHASRDYDERWERGYAQMLESSPYALRNWDITSNTSNVIHGPDSGARRADRFIAQIRPFFIEVEDDASTLGLVAEDRFARVLRQLEAASQKAVEEELWDGAIAQGESLVNPYLTKAATVTTLNSGTALSAKRALALLEHYIGTTSPFGEQGVIHMTRDVAAILSSNSQMLFHEKGKDHHQTHGGTPVIIGSGYSGAGPVGATGASATDTNKWMYATGSLRVHLGKPEVVNDTLAQGYDVSGNANDMKIKAYRSASVFFDTSIHLAVRVDLTAA